MSSNPPSPATSELRMEMTPAELEEWFVRTKGVLDDEGNWIPLTIVDTIDLSWPRVARMGESLRDISTGTLEELIKKYPDEPAAGLWTAIAASRSYKSVSTLLEERTALLQSCRSPVEYMLTLETLGVLEEDRLEAKEKVNRFFAEVDNYKGPLLQTLREVTRLLNAYMEKVKLVFRESSRTLTDPAYWESIRFFMQSSDLLELCQTKRGFSMKELKDLDRDPISNLKALRIDALGEIKRVTGVTREFPKEQAPPL